MKKVLAALVVAAFSLGMLGTAMAVPAQAGQHRSPATQVQADKANQGTAKKKQKAAKKKPTKKKTTAKKAPKKAA